MKLDLVHHLANGIFVLEVDTIVPLLFIRIFEVTDRVDKYETCFLSEFTVLDVEVIIHHLEVIQLLLKLGHLFG